MSFVPRLNLVRDVSAGDWLGEQADYSGVQNSGVPACFDCYVQVLHPARRPGGDVIRWREIAAWLDKPLLPGVWFQDLEEFARRRPDAKQPWNQEPHLGEIPDDVLDSLVGVLARHTSSEHGWFCLWEGWGQFNGAASAAISWPIGGQPPPGTPSQFIALPAFPRQVPKVSRPHRDYLLFEGPLAAVGELGAWVDWEPAPRRTFEQHTPSLWWPDDHAWCAGNEVDASFTCIGGTRPLIDELLKHPELETLELDSTQRFSPYTDLHDRPHE